MQRYDISWRQGGVCNATGPVHVTMHMDDDAGPAAFVIDALQLATDVRHAETFDKAESGYFELQDGREFRVIVEKIDRSYLHTPEACPSKHWNRGDDICSDCGEHLG